MKIIELSIDDIKPYEKNPRKNDKWLSKNQKKYGYKYKRNKN